MENLDFVPDETPEHKEVREALEVCYELGRLTLEQCLESYKDWESGHYG